MPINFLQNIKMSMSTKSKLITGQEVLYNELKTANTWRIHVFSCKDLKPNQSLFNDGLPSLIFLPQKSDIVQLSDKGETVKFNSAWVCCGEIKNIYWKMPIDLEYIMVLRFKPSTFYSLFNVNSSVFHSNPICNLEDIISENWMRIFDKMYEKKTIFERISFLEKALSSFQPNDCFPHILSNAIEYIEYKKGNTSVSDVLNQLGKKVNPKWLHRNFVKYIGISPKRYILLQRFIYTYGQCKKSNLEDLLDIAMLSGYYDYNHFFKDFKRYIGISPSQYTWE